MKEQLNGIIAQLETIPVSGVNAIKMGNALLGLITLRDNLPDEQPDEQPEEGETECQP